MLANGVPGSNRLIPQQLRGVRSRFEEGCFLDHPAIPEDRDVLRRHVSVSSAHVPLHRHGIASGPLKNHLVPDLWLREGLRHRPLNVFAPDLPVASRNSQSHEIRGIFVRIMPVGVRAVVEEPPGDPLSRSPVVAVSLIGASLGADV